VGDDEALAAFRRLCRLEGIIPALEPSHAVAWLLGAGIEAAAGPERNGGAVGPGLDLLTLSGRGDKDLAEVLGLD
jgi:tryptophan synthase beta chain